MSRLTTNRQNILSISLLLLSTHLYAASNPASTHYVQRAIEAADYSAGHGIQILNRVISTTPFVSVGDFYQGGVVFYVDATGRHGLMVALENQSSSQLWLAGCNTSIGEPVCPWTLATANGIGAGKSNTNLIIAAETQFNPTAGLSAAQSASIVVDGTTGKVSSECAVPASGAVVPTNTNCIGGWYLPSIYEMSIALQTLAGRFDSTFTEHAGTPLKTNSDPQPNFYWTSNEDVQRTAFTVVLNNADREIQLDEDNKGNDTNNNVRAIRQF